LLEGVGNVACPCDPHASSVRRHGIQDEWQRKEVDSAYKLPPQFSPLPSKAPIVFCCQFLRLSLSKCFFLFVDFKFNVVTCCN
jgi:hypothetical protein